MAIIVDDKPTGESKQYPLPTEGLHLLVLADVADLGVVPNEKFGARREVALSWVVNEQDSEGNYFVIRRNFNASLNEGSHLYACITDMYGKNPPKSLDLETLLGHLNNGVVAHADGKGRNAGKKFANIKAFLAAPKGSVFAIPKDYIREKDGGKYGKKLQKRGSGAGTAGAGSKPAPTPEPEVADEDIPF